MDPSIPPSSPFVQVLVETPNRCPGDAAAAVLPVCAAAKPPSRLPSSTPPDFGGGGSYPSVGCGGGASCALSARRRRTLQDDPTDQPSPAATDMIGRFRTIIKIVESRGPPARPRPEIGELLKALQCLKLRTGEPRHPRKKRCRRPPVSPTAEAGGRSSVSLLQETIAAIEQMRLAEPVERSDEYAEVLGKLKKLLRTQDLEDG